MRFVINIVFTIGIFLCFLIQTCYSQEPEWIIYNTKSSDLPQNKLKSITNDLEGNLWLGTAGDGGVWFDRVGEWRIYNESTSKITNNHVDSIAVDLNGNIWFGTGNGVCVFDGDTTWIKYQTSNSGLPNDDIYPVAIDRSQGTSDLREQHPSVWIGTYGDGVVKFDGENWTEYKSNNTPLIDDLIRSIAIDSEGNKWIGTLFGGLTKFNGDATWENYSKFNSQLPSDAVYPIVFDSIGNVWVGTEGGVAVLNKNQNWTVYNTENSGLPHNKVHSLKIDKEGIVWIGTVKAGLARFDPNAIDTVPAWKVYNTFNSALPWNEIRGIHIDENNFIWLATFGGGLARLNENGSGWKNTGWDNLSSFDPDDSSSWSLLNLTGLVEKIHLITNNQKQILSNKLDLYIKENPTSVEAKVLKVKVGMHKGESMYELGLIIDKALLDFPEHPEVNYLKGLMYGPVYPMDGTKRSDFEFFNYEKSIEHIKIAVEKDENNDLYKETLAAYYSIKRNFEEARKYTKHINDGELPIYGLLNDLRLLVYPTEAVYLPDESFHLSKELKDKAEFEDFYNLRVQVYSIPLSAIAVELFYQERWSQFDFFEISYDKKAKSVVMKQYLTSWEDQLYSTSKVSDIPNNPRKGITMDLTSIYRKASKPDPNWITETLKLSPTLENRKVFCKLVYINYRDK